MPASGPEVLKTSVIYGADAVYIGGESFGLRAGARNFSLEEISEAIAFAHSHGARVYITANIFAHNRDLEGAAHYFKKLSEIGPDALIISDPGMFSLAKEHCPGIELHISTQANNTNYETYKFWHSLGAKRVVSARELTLTELSEIREHIPKDLEIETFIHGAMCISYSGRCLLSNYFTGRDGNQGACTHPCRWKYHVPNGNACIQTGCEGGNSSMQAAPAGDYCSSQAVSASDGSFLQATITEDTRPNELLPVVEDDRGTYIFNSKDLCMIEHIPELIRAGIDSFKVEGRMKTALYAATIARAYRRAIDDALESEELYLQNLPTYVEEVRKCTHRRYDTGFFFGKPSEQGQIYDESTYINDYVYMGTIESVDGSTAVLTQKNKFCVGDILEIIKPDGRNIESRVLSIKDAEGNPMESCPHASMKIFVSFETMPEKYDVLRKKKG